MRPVMGAVAAGALAALLFVSDGVAVSWDGEAYLAAAQAIREFGGIPRDWAAFPPLYPILLAAAPTALMLTWAATLNVLALAGVTGAVVALTVGEQWLIVVLVICGPPLRFVQGWVLAEPVFILLVMLFAIGVQRRSWAMMTTAAGLAALQRYVGVTLIPAGTAALWMMGKRGKIPMFAVGAGLPVGLWMLRNVATVGAPMGVRLAGAASLDMSVQAVIDTMIGWLPLLIAAWLGAPRANLSRAGRWALAIYCVGHAALVVWGASTTNLDAPGDRLLAPMFVPTLLLVTGMGILPRLEER